MGGERQSLIDVELARTEFRLDVIKLRKQLSEIRGSDKAASEVAVVTTLEGTSIEPAGESAAASPVTPSKPEPSPAGSA